MNISLKPMVWMYLQYGVALEAHQQNSVVQLKDGYRSNIISVIIKDFISVIQ